MSAWVRQRAHGRAPLRMGMTSDFGGRGGETAVYDACVVVGTAVAVPVGVGVAPGWASWLSLSRRERRYLSARVTSVTMNWPSWSWEMLSLHPWKRSERESSQPKLMLTWPRASRPALMALTR